MGVVPGSTGIQSRGAARGTGLSLGASGARVGLGESGGLRDHLSWARMRRGDCEGE